jgi:hypothetical protein
MKLTAKPVWMPEEFSNYNSLKEGNALFPLLFKMLLSNT